MTTAFNGTEVTAMRDYKTVGVRLSQHEDKAIEQLARDHELTVSELVRLWLEQAVKQAWQQRHAAGKGV